MSTLLVRLGRRVTGEHFERLSEIKTGHEKVSRYNTLVGGKHISLYNYAQSDVTISQGGNIAKLHNAHTDRSYHYRQ